MSNKRSSGQDQQDQQDQDDSMAPEYDFSHSIQGKHAIAMRNGYTMVIQRSDGTREVREIAPRAGTVVLDPDVRAYFPDSEAVNRALRGLIGLLPQHPTPSETR
ncbi:MAG: hypothetical protein OJF49_002254 [Ktedonobacterales bacterium]|nr:MAG: hypothetical protein OJF49_002254 [Ktedonobacterales bacterium]